MWDRCNKFGRLALLVTCVDGVVAGGGSLEDDGEDVQSKFIFCSGAISIAVEVFGFTKTVNHESFAAVGKIIIYDVRLLSSSWISPKTRTIIKLKKKRSIEHCITFYTKRKTFMTKWLNQFSRHIF